MWKQFFLKSQVYGESTVITLEYTETIKISNQTDWVYVKLTQVTQITKALCFKWLEWYEAYKKLDILLFTSWHGTVTVNELVEAVFLNTKTVNLLLCLQPLLQNFLGELHIWTHRKNLKILQQKVNCFSEGASKPQAAGRDLCPCNAL